MRGVFAREEAPAAGALDAWIVNAEGERERLESFRYDLAAAAFTFELPLRAGLAYEPGATLMEKLAFPSRLSSGAAGQGIGFAQRSTGRVRFELFPKSVFTETGKAVPYLQVFADVPRSAANSARASLQIGSSESPLHFVQAVALPVRIVEETGAALPGARVQAVALAAAGELGKAAPLTPEEAPGLTPVVARTDASGKAVVFPVSAQGASQRYQVMADATGRCPVFSPQLHFQKPAHGGVPPELELKMALACSEESKRADPVPWSVRFAPEVKVFPLPQDPKGPSYGHTSRNELELVFNPVHIQNRGIEVALFEGVGEGARALENTLFPAFVPNARILLPQVFPNSGRPEGSFELRVSVRETDGKGRLVETLRGVRSLAKPVPLAKDFELWSFAGVRDVISGVRGRGGFRVTVRNGACDARAEIAVVVGKVNGGPAQARFKPCAPEGISFEIEDSALVSAVPGENPVFFYIRNAYGLVNENIPDEQDLRTFRNQGKVWIDFDAPDLARQPLPLQSTFGFADASAASESGFSFPAQAGLRLTLPAPELTLAGIVLRFVDAAECRLGAALPGDFPVQALPALTSAASARSLGGHSISHFRLQGDGTAPTRQAFFESATKCGEALVPRGSQFVRSANGLSTWLVVSDVSGNLSAPALLEIPQCVGDGPQVGQICAP